MVVRSRNAIILSIWLAVLSLWQRRCFVESFISSEFSVLKRTRGNSYRLHAVTRARGKQTSPPKEERTVKRYSPVNEERRSHYSPVKRQLRNQSPPRNSTLIEAIERKQDIYSALSMAKGGKADAALKLFESLVVSGECVIRRKECNLLIKELGDNGFLQHCNDVLRIMKRARISPSLITYSTLISRAGSWLKVSLAEEYFREMMSLKIAPDLSCYNSLINAYAKVGNTAQAVEIFESMASEGGVAPNVVTYNTIVDAFARVGNTFQILTLMRRMRSENITANERTYCALIQSYCFNDQVGVALNLTSQLERDKYRVSEITYSTLLHSLGRAGDLNSTFDLLRSMRAKGIRLNMVTMSSLIDACAKHGQLSLALRLYEDMQRSSRKQDRPNSITCSSLVDACLKNKQVDQAFKILHDMREQDIKLTEVTYTSLISELTRLNMLDRIEEIFQGAPQGEWAYISAATHSSSQFFPVSAKTISSEGCIPLHEERPEDLHYSMALERYEEIKAKGETPSERVFRDLMDSFYSKAMASSSSFSAAPVPESAFITEEERLETTELLQKRHNALFRLYLIFQEMKINGVRPDAAVYNTLINACAGAGDLEKALETVAAMQAERVAPNVITYTSLIKACGISGAEGAVELAEEIFSAMQQRTNHFSTYIEPTMLTFQRLIQVHLRAGATLDDTKRVWELWRDLLSRGLKPGMTICRSCVRAAKLEGDASKALDYIDYIRKNTLAKFDFRSWLMAMQLCAATGHFEEERILREEIEAKTR